MSEFDDEGEPVVNFRHILPGIQKLLNLYRSSAPESVANKIGCDDADLTVTERFILKDVDLILDLRSSKEGDTLRKQKLVTKSPGGPFEVFQDEIPESFQIGTRYKIGIDILGDKSELLKFIDDNWLEPNELQGLDETAVLMKRRSSFSSRGLAGLNHMLLERKQSMCLVLKLITQFLEQIPNGKLLVHCTAGKDRTGMVCMLLQTVAGFSDEDIITEYTISETEAKHIMARALKRQSNPLIDPAVLSGASREGIQGALTYLRSTYGSVDQYLDDIGFDAMWRHRLHKILLI